MNPLPLQDQRLLEAAEGWLGLGDRLAAQEELDQITASFRAHPAVLTVRYQICAKAKNWEGAVDLARTLTQALPEDAWGHLHLAFALHELKRTQAAYDTLRPVVEKFPQEWLLRFNLACYACQLGDLQEAMVWLERAFALAGKKYIRLQALEDRDLEPLWSRIAAL